MATRSSNDILTDILSTLNFIIHELKTFYNKIVDESSKTRSALKNKGSVNNTGSNSSDKSMGELISAMNNIQASNTGNKGNANISDIINGIKELNKLDTKKVDRAVTTIKKLSDAINNIHINSESTKGFTQLGQLVKGISSLDDISLRTYTLIRMGVLTMLAKQITLFSKALNISVQSTLAQDSLNKFIINISLLLSTLKNVNKIPNNISKKTALRISDFFSTLLNGLPGDNNAVEKSKALVLLSLAISNINASALVALGLASIFIGKKSGKAINEFLSEILKIADNHKASDIKEVGVLFKELSNAVLKITGAIALTALIAITFPMDSIIASLAIIGVVTIGMVTVATLLSLRKNAIIKGINGIKHLSESVLLISGAIALMTGIVVLTDVQTVQSAVGIVLLVTAAMTGVALLLAKNNKTIIKGIEGIRSLTISILLITTSIGLMTVLLDKYDVNTVLTGVGVVVGVVGIMVAMVGVLSMLKKDGLDEANKTMITLTGILTVVSLVSLLVFPKIAENADTILKGAGVVGIVMLGLVGMTLVLSLIGKKKLHDANMTMLTLTAVLVIVSLTALFILAPLGDLWEAAAKGGVVVLGVIGIMVLMTVGISMIKNKALTESLVTLGVLTVMLVVISLTVEKLLIPIGEQWKSAAKGGTVVLGIIGIMTGIVFALSKIKSSGLLKGTISLVAITAIFVAITYITNKYLIPIGKQWKSAAKGGAVVVSIIGILGGIVVAVSKAKLSKAGIAKAAVTLGGMVALLTVVSNITKKYLIPIGKQGKAAATGGAVVEGIITGLGIIGLAVAKGVSKLPLGELVKGGLVIAGMATLLLYVAKTLKPYIEVSKLAANNKMNILVGGGMIVGILTAWGLLMAGIGALVSMPPVAIVLAIGAATITGIATVMGVLSLAMNAYIKLSKNLVKELTAVRQGQTLVALVLTSMKSIIMKVGEITSIGDAFNMATGTVAVNAISEVMWALSKGMIPFIHTIKLIKDNNITTSTVQSFRNIVIGSKTGIYDTLHEIIDKLNDIGLLSLAKANLISRNIQPIFDTIGKFFEVIKNASSMKYVSEWDKNGKPKAYKTITMAMLKSAATTVSKAFGEFLTEFGKGMRGLKGVSAWSIYWLGKSIGPVMQSVASFTDSILKVITTSIPYEWDKDGKPIKFRPFRPSEFKRAAIVITDSFATFLETMTPRLKNISGIAGIVVAQLRLGIEPVMRSIGVYTDAILKMINGLEISYTDAKGNEVKRFIPFNPSKFKKGAADLADCFIGFIDTLYNKFKAQNYTEHNYQIESHWYGDTKIDNAKLKNKVSDLINGMAGIELIITQVNNYLDMVYKIGAKSKSIDIKKTSETIARSYTDFVGTISDKFSSQQQLKAILNAIQAVKESSKIFKQFASIFDNLADMYKDDAKNAEQGIAAINRIISNFISTDYLKKLTQLHVITHKYVLPAVNDLSYIANGFANMKVNGTNIDVAKANRNAKYLSDSIITISQALQEYTKVPTRKISFKALVLLTNTITKSLAATSFALNKYFKNFKDFDGKLRKEFTVYSHVTTNTTKVTNSFRQAIVKLDNALISKELQRNRVFLKLKENIGSIALEINKVNKALQENQQLLFDLNRIMLNAVVQSTLLLHNNNRQGKINELFNRNNSENNRRLGDLTGVTDTRNIQQNNRQGSIEDIAARLSQAVTSALDTWVAKSMEILVMYQGLSNANYGKVKMRR